MNTTVDRIDRFIVQNPIRRTPRTATEAERLLADIRALAPNIAGRAAEIEAARRIPLDLVETLRSIGIFRMVAPHSHGGLEFDLPTGLSIITIVPHGVV
jgi:alkylation response protein AidB-like acyl-CoA dehydrogenase